MALHHFVCCITVTILLWKGCHSQQPACGRVAKTNRIIGGEDASPGSWPWHAFIVTYGPYGFTQCGGSLITNQWVLTAAQCIPSSSYNTEVHLGRYNQSGLNPNEVTQTVEDVICHPAFTNYWLYENDICLLKLSAPVNFTEHIQPICLASENSTLYNGTSSWITGFGYNSDNYYGNAKILQEVNVPILGNNECSCYFQNSYSYYYGFPKITENMTCTGPTVGWKGPCYGDAGEPLMTKAESVWVQSGIASNNNCGRPSVYTRVSQYEQWITDTVTGTKPGFVTFTSSGPDSDLSFTCPTSPPTTFPPCYPPSYLLSYPTDNSTSYSADFPVHSYIGDSVFSGGENLIHFTHFSSLCVFTLLLHLSIGNGM